MGGFDVRFGTERVYPLSQVKTEKGAEKGRGNRDADTPSFGDVLSSEISKRSSLKFSKHAQERLSTEGVEMTPERIRRLEEAVSKARSKAARETLVLMEGVAFVVSVKNSTVITVVEEKRMKENVFTNIDSAVIV
ncbi:MAG: Flagellar operon protein [Clostridia bacterium 41_269]|nr:MAG: Flagellar operon protein [Clostridia bacterium 41_269]